MQKLARHSTVELTIGRYTHTNININDLRSAVQQMTPLPLTTCTGQTTQPDGSTGQSLVALMVAGFPDNHCDSVRTAEDRPPTDEPVEPENTDSRNPCQRKTLDTDCGCLSAIDKAERQGFEPWVPLRVLRFSRPVHGGHAGQTCWVTTSAGSQGHDTLGRSIRQPPDFARERYGISHPLP
jgi:hypothetical protein